MLHVAFEITELSEVGKVLTGGIAQRLFKIRQSYGFRRSPWPRVPYTVSYCCVRPTLPEHCMALPAKPCTDRENVVGFPPVSDTDTMRVQCEAVSAQLRRRLAWRVEEAIMAKRCEICGKGPDTATTSATRTTSPSGAGIQTCKGLGSKRLVGQSAFAFVPAVYARAGSRKRPKCRGYGCHLPRRVFFTRSTDNTLVSPLRAA